MAGEWGRETTFAQLIDDGALEIGDGYRAKNEELGGGAARSSFVQDTSPTRTLTSPASSDSTWSLSRGFAPNSRSLETPLCVGNRETEAPKQVASMRPRRACLGKPDAAAWHGAERVASMRPRHACLGKPRSLAGLTGAASRGHLRAPRRSLRPTSAAGMRRMPILPDFSVLLKSLACRERLHGVRHHATARVRPAVKRSPPAAAPGRTSSRGS